jgi:hypothetical protein
VSNGWKETDDASNNENNKKREKKQFEGNGMENVRRHVKSRNGRTCI